MQDVIDSAALERLLSVIGGDPEDLAELIEDFEEETPQTLEQMTKAAAASDVDALRLSAHSLKSNARDFGATALADACETLEHDCKAGGVTDAAARAAAIARLLDEARAALAALSGTHE